jgi:predicted MFS family arabinose efflux permease
LRFPLRDCVCDPTQIHRLGRSATRVGLALAAFGVGIVIGALVAARLMSRLALGNVVAIGPVLGLVAALVMVLTILVPSITSAAQLGHIRTPLVDPATGGRGRQTHARALQAP